MSPLSNMATSAAVRPPTLWVPPWSSAVTLATPWSRAPSSLSVSTSTTPSGMRQSQPAEVSGHQWVGLSGWQAGWVLRSQPQGQGPEALLGVIDISPRGRRWGPLAVGGHSCGQVAALGHHSGENAPSRAPLPCSRVQRGDHRFCRRGALSKLAGALWPRAGLHLGCACGGGQAHHAGRPSVSASGQASRLLKLGTPLVQPTLGPSPSPSCPDPPPLQAAHRLWGHTDHLRWGRPDSPGPGPVLRTPRPLQALYLHG